MGVENAAQRRASPAAHATKQAFKLTDESRAFRGRVHAFVRWRGEINHSSSSSSSISANSASKSTCSCLYKSNARRTLNDCDSFANV